MTGAPRYLDPPRRVLVVDDSPLYRLRFARLFGRLRDLTVVGVAADGEEAVRLVASAKPDVVLLDLTMPGMDGFAVLRWVMANAPVPVVVCSSRGDRESVFKALELGAVDYVVKPTVREDVARVEALVVEHVRAAAEARLGAPAAVGESVPALPPRRARAGVIAIAASTGGPAAIQRLVRRLPAALSVPIVVVQHMPTGFTRLFAERLNRHSHYAVAEARDGETLAPGTIAVAPGGVQTRVARDGERATLSVAARADDEVYAPSADALFGSVAEAFGPTAVAVVLTGMGDDGSRGIERVRAAGGYVVVESSESALIYGMPRAAVATGAVDAQLPLDLVADALFELSRP